MDMSTASTVFSGHAHGHVYYFHVHVRTCPLACPLSMDMSTMCTCVQGHVHGVPMDITRTCPDMCTCSFNGHVHMHVQCWTCPLVRWACHFFHGLVQCWACPCSGGMCPDTIGHVQTWTCHFRTCSIHIFSLPLSSSISYLLASLLAYLAHFRMYWRCYLIPFFQP